MLTAVPSDRGERALAAEAAAAAATGAFGGAFASRVAEQFWDVADAPCAPPPPRPKPKPAVTTTAAEPTAPLPAYCHADWTALPPTNTRWNAMLFPRAANARAVPGTNERTLEDAAVARPMMLNTPHWVKDGVARFSAGDYPAQSTPFSAKRRDDFRYDYAAHSCYCDSTPQPTYACTCQDSNLYWTKSADCGEQMVRVTGNVFTGDPRAQDATPVYNVFVSDVRDCPILGEPSDGGGVVADSVERVQGADTGAVPRVRCHYDSKKIAASCSAASDWIKVMRETQPTQGLGVTYDTGIMRELCAGKTAAGDPNMQACPICHSWAQQLDYQDGGFTGGKCDTDPNTRALKGTCPASESDVIIGNWCADESHRRTPACRCTRRADYSDWYDFGTAFPENPGCWYSPCAGGMQGGLVQYAERNASLASCHDICQNIVTLVNSDYNKFENVVQSITCPGIKKPDGGGGDPVVGGGSIPATTIAGAVGATAVGAALIGLLGAGLGALAAVL